MHDARIAAICLGNGVAELWSADRDFGRFPELRVVNPLVEPGMTAAHGHFASGGSDERIASTLPPVLSPKMVPRS